MPAKPSRLGHGECPEEAVMTSTMQEQSSAQAPAEGRASRFLVPDMWATVSIVAMWLAVLFVGVWGGDVTIRGADTSYIAMPSGVAVALFAAIGTGSVAKRVFGRRSG
jgi:hypothetical protein